MRLRHLETTVSLSVEHASSLCRHKNSSLQDYIPDEQFGFQYTLIPIALCTVGLIWSAKNIENI